MKLLYTLLLGFLVTGVAHAAVVTLSLPTAGTLKDQFGNPIPDNALIQLVNLGADGVFNPIVFNPIGGGIDGDVTTLGQWVSGDDTLVNSAFGNADAATFPTAAAFDLRDGSDSGANGILIRDFIGLTGVTSGDKFGIRWWPSIVATNFNSTTLTNGIRYGEFTRQGTALYGGTLWVMPADGANELIDSFATVSGPGGSDADTLGLASGTTFGPLGWVGPWPEPAASVFTMIGAIILSNRRRRLRGC